MSSEQQHTTSTVLLLGDEGIGKTSLALTITQGVFPAAASLHDPSMPTPPISQTTPKTSITTGDTCHIIEVIDPKGAELDDDVTNGKQIDVVCLCFDIGSHATFDTIQSIWLPKAKHVCKKNKNGTHFILVGLKADQDDRATHSSQSDLQPSGPITTSVANQLANEINAFMYVQVSSLKYLGIEKLKEQTVFCKMENRNSSTSTLKRNTKCTLM